MGHKDTKAIGDQATASGFKTQAEEDEANDRAIVQAYAELLQEEEKQEWSDSYIPQGAPAGNAYNDKSPRTKARPPKRPQEVSPQTARRPVGGGTSGTKR